MEQAFEGLMEKRGFWQKGSTVLVAVSGGVDSMVLLELMQQQAAKIGFSLRVAHVNHQLRTASTTEEEFLREYCTTRQIPFACRRWENPPLTGLENAARRFRYQFFAELMEQKDSPILVTAHHSDDQAETILMKLIRDGNLSSAVGIKESQAFGKGQLIRPLLSFSKAELQAYAIAKQIPFYEDETNLLLNVQRNRLRHQVMPVLKAENPQLLAHFQQFSQQLTWAQELIAEEQQAWWAKTVRRTEESWSFSLTEFCQLATSHQFFYLQYFFAQAQKEFQVAIKQEQLLQILELLPKAQWRIDLAEDWRVVKEYQQLKLQKKAPQISATSFQLAVGESLFLSENEWVTLLPADNQPNLPKKVKDWSEISQPFPVNFPSPVILRKRRPGDRIQLTSTLRKKVSRLLIDQKIPNEKREQVWLLCDQSENVLAVLPLVFSYLSIAKETDKIHYRLIYKYRSRS